MSADIKIQVEKLCGKIINVVLSPQYFLLEPFLAAMKNDKKRSGMKLAAILMDSDFSLHKVQDIEEDEPALYPGRIRGHGDDGAPAHSRPCDHDGCYGRLSGRDGPPIPPYGRMH